MYIPNMTIAKRLDTAMKAAGFETQSALSRKSGVPQPTINRILKGLGKKGPETETIKKLAAACNVSASWLIDETNETRQTGGDAYNAGPEQNLPKGKYVALVGIGQGGADGYISINDYLPGDGDGYIYTYSRDPGAYGLRVRGDSMRPRIKSGEFLVVEPTSEAQPGDDVVVKLNNDKALVKEMLWVREDEVSLGSINNGIPPITIQLADIRSIHRVAAIVPRGSALLKARE
jgi:phage repressor protein C with HTH and peptisase S24 domain